MIREATCICVMGMVFLVGFYSSRWLPRKLLGVVVGALMVGMLLEALKLAK